MSEYTVVAGTLLSDVLVAVGICTSKSDAKRLIEQGGVSLADAKVTEVFATVSITEPAVLQAGKRHFVRLLP